MMVFIVPRQPCTKGFVLEKWEIKSKRTLGSAVAQILHYWALMRGAEVMIFNIFSNIDLLTCTVTEKNNENLIKTCMHIYIYIYIFTIKDEEKGKDNNKICDGSTKKKTFLCKCFFSLSTNFLMNFFKFRICLFLLASCLFGCQENKEN